ncbi:DUF423 domain-containing protein [Aquimarina hainanensis]|uniref:DUF423 domain-containing protein n=1 Tax=Aquimarina hainanensis TaxID=1578017 RepID=A0ABW5N1U3_9FLAO|nr:DUF423 domain-containing protein [Aquimarina sp. TRL1]QKX04430.1 DUF423 domain-containing protein [Aquimarina sp. TRL1]
MNKAILITGVVAGMLAVILGAFGAHGLKKIVDLAAVDSFNTGVRYQMYHAIVLLVLGSMSKIEEQRKKSIFYLFTMGMVLFSGSIYLLVVDQSLGIDLSGIGFVTPIGGSLLIVGWFLFLRAIIKIK